MSIYTNLNSNDLALQYTSSYRPGGSHGLTLDHLYGQDGFNIHSFMPSEYVPGAKGLAVQGIRTTKGFDMTQLPIPKVKPELEDEVKKYWRSMKKERSWRDQLKYQANKHLKYNKLQGGDVIEVALIHGKKFVSEGEAHYLMDILERNGYRGGQIYSCKRFAEDLEKEIGGVKVTFKPHPDGQALGVLYLHEVHVLYSLDAKSRIPRSRQQSFDDDDVFLLEDLRLRRKTSLVLHPGQCFLKLSM